MIKSTNTISSITIAVAFATGVIIFRVGTPIKTVYVFNTTVGRIRVGIIVGRRGS